MNIDINALKEGLKSINIAMTLVKQLMDFLPKSPKKTKATEALENAERQLRLAEAQTMQGLGYELCRNHEIPEIMLSKDDQDWECPRCKNKKYTGATIGPNPFYN